MLNLKLTILKSNLKTQTFASALVTVAAIATASASFGQNLSHNYVNSYRSSSISHVFVSQSVEGEFGTYEFQNPDSTNLTNSISTVNSKWRGYNITQTFGLEVMKFIQFNVAHSMMNMRANSSSLDRLGGSRFSAGARLVFLAPVANLEAGGGVIGTRYDYQHRLKTSDYYGSGIYYSLGFNYFLSERVSLFGQAKTIDEHSIRTGGDNETKTISSKTTNIGTGFTLWL